MTILLISLIILVFLIRILIASNARMDFDTFGHLYFANQLSKYNLGPFSTIPVNVIDSKEFKHPFLFHWILVKIIGINFLKRNQQHINNFIELIFLFLFVIISWQVIQDLDVGLMISLLYLSTPLLTISDGAGPRLYSFTPRLFSEVLTNLYFLLVFTESIENTGLVFIICSIIAFAVIISVKFGLQALFFIGVTSSIFSFSLFPIIPLFSAICIAIVITKGGFIKTLKIHYEHLLWYYQRAKDKNFSLRHRSSFKGLWMKGSGVLRNVYSIIFRKLHTKGILAGMVLFSSLLPTIYLLITNPGVDVPYFIPIVAGITIFLLVNVPRLLIFGESERYLRHVAFVIIVTFVTLANYSGNVLLFYFVLAFNLTYLALQARIVVKRKKYVTNDKYNINRRITEYLKGIDDQRKIICFPYHIGSYYSILLETKHYVLGVLCTDFETHPVVMEKLELEYSFLDLNRLNYMKERFGIDTLIIDRNALKNVGLENWQVPENWEMVESFSQKADIYFLNV